MKVTRYLFLALILSVGFATSALALPANKVLTVQLSRVGAAGQVVPIRSISVTSDAAGKVAFNLTAVPTSDVTPFLVVRILDGATMLRQSLFVAPPPNGAANVGVSEVTTSQATAMLKAFADAGGGSTTLAAMILNMVRSGAISDIDLRNVSPLARAAATAFESFLTDPQKGGVSSAQLSAFRTSLLSAMRDFGATYKESVDVVSLANDVNTADPALDAQNKALSNQNEARKRGDAIARFLAALVNAGADAGIAPTLLHLAMNEAGKAVEMTASGVSADLVTVMVEAFRTGAAHCQLRGELRAYTGALPFFNMTSAAAQQTFHNMSTTSGGQRQFKNMTSATKQQQFTATVQRFNAAAGTLGDAMVSAQEVFELIFSDPTHFPTLTDITFARDNLIITLQSLTTNLITDTTATPGDITTMQRGMASGMGGVVMSNMSSLQRQGVGSMFTTPTASSQLWVMMMVAGANFVAPPIQLSYSSAIPAQVKPGLLVKYPQLPTPPDYSLINNPYKSLLRLQYDLMLLKFNNQLALSSAVQPVSETVLVGIKENDLSLRNTMLQKITISGIGNSADLANALMIALAQPELL